MVGVEGLVPDSELGAFVRSHEDDILRAWEREVRKLPVAGTLDRPALLDHVPDLLAKIADIADALARGSTLSVPKELAEVHAIERLDEGFDLAQVVAEFGILRDCILSHWVEASKLAELRIVNQAIDRAVTATIDRFARARDRTLLALDRIANEAIESRTLDELLQRVLQVFVDTTAAVDAAGVEIVHNGELRLRVKRGVEGAGRAHYDVPLMDSGNVIGRAQMWSLTAHEFSSQDKRLFRAMANRAAAAIYQHILRESLRDRELELRSLADNIPQLAWITDARGSIYWYNQRWFDFTGTTLDEVRGAGWQRVLHPDHLQRVLEQFQRAVASGEAWEDLFPMRGRDGRYRWFLSRAVPVRDEHERIVRWFGTNTDVTEQRFLSNAASLLATSLDVKDTLAQLARLAVPDLADWCIVDVLEEGYLELVAVVHGDPSKATLAQQWPQRVRPEGKPGVSDAIATGQPLFYPQVTDELLADKLGMHGERYLRQVHALGIESCIITPLVARGRTLGAITLLLADSGRRYTRAELDCAVELGRRAGLAIDNARLYAAAQDALHAREEILAIVSHDLRSPLNVIELSASLAEQGDDLQRRLEQIRRSAARMDRLLGDLLDTAALQVGRFVLQRAREPLATLLADAVEANEPIARKKGIAIEREYDLQGAVVDCDRERLLQAIGNLLGNAIKFCSDGDAIRVAGSYDGRTATISIKDSGPGIAHDELPHIFEPYWSARRHARTGTGLGLYICKGIVEAHGGTIIAHSTPARGTTFMIELPIAPRP